MKRRGFFRLFGLAVAAAATGNFKLAKKRARGMFISEYRCAIKPFPQNQWTHMIFFKSELHWNSEEIAKRLKED